MYILCIIVLCIIYYSKNIKNILSISKVLIIRTFEIKDLKFVQ